MLAALETRAMIKPLTSDEQAWVNATLASMDRNARLAQLLMPTLGGDYANLAEIEEVLRGGIALGGVFASGATRERHVECLARLQSISQIPLVVAADLERGPGPVIVGDVMFPDPLAVAAADDAAGARMMGTAAALEGRAAGIHWTFAPVADINLNPQNPIANTRSLGDDPEKISRLIVEILSGMQASGLAACAKHFPGDGVDLVDQHITTSVNSLPMERWWATFGKTFGSAIEAGVWSIMIGHIALPAWDPVRNECGVPRPGTLSPRIILNLLRKGLGFQGIIVSDDMNMGGVACYTTRRVKAVGCIAAGCDIFLFPRLPEDYHALVEAADSGELTGERIDDAARRVLEFKARLGLQHNTAGRPTSDTEKASFRSASKKIARNALVKVRDVRGLLPLRGLKAGSKILTITISVENGHLPVIDLELARRGFLVEHRQNPTECRPFETLEEYDAVFVNLSFRATWAYGSAGCTGFHNRIFLGAFPFCHPRVVFTSFGSPYSLREYRNFPNLINAHSNSPDSQQAAVAAWFGEISFAGSSPVGGLEFASYKPPQENP